MNGQHGMANDRHPGAARRQDRRLDGKDDRRTFTQSAVLYILLYHYINLRRWSSAHPFIIQYRWYFGIGRRTPISKQESRKYGVY